MKKGPIRVCLISVEIFAYGKFGGFGKVVRIIGSELVKRGYEVFAVVPRRLDQPAEETMDGITVLGYLPGEVLRPVNYTKRLMRIFIIPANHHSPRTLHKSICLMLHTCQPFRIRVMHMIGTWSFYILH